MLNNRELSDEKIIEDTMEQVVSTAQSIPISLDLTTVINDSANAAKRSYYLPDEDERLRSVFASYLRSRAILLDTLDCITPLLKNKLTGRNELRAFAVGYTSGCLLVRATTYIIETARKHPVIWEKLDESEQRYGIERKSISRLYESLSSPKKMLQLHQATRFFDSSKSKILELKNLTDLDRELIQILEQEQPFIESRKRDFLKLRLRYRLYDIVRRNTSGYKKAMFHLFRLTGSMVAEMKQPMKKSSHPSKGTKRVTSDILEEIRSSLSPGDIIITRHDDALSNLFLPGFWPHAAFYMGSTKQLESINLPDLPPTKHEIIEAKKDGVKFRPISETLSVDNFVVIRPSLKPESLIQAIQTAISHAGKRYDFLFDFTKSNRLACTELVYRAYHGADNLQFTLHERSGRLCVSAEDLMNQMMHSGQFSIHALFSQTTDRILYGSEAKTALKKSYSADW